MADESRDEFASLSPRSVGELEDIKRVGSVGRDGLRGALQRSVESEWEEAISGEEASVKERL